MRTTRKLLALLLAVAMVFTMTAMTALATGGDDGTTTPDGGTPTTPGGGTTTPDGGTPTTPGGGTTPAGGTTTPGGGPATPDDPTTPGDPATPEVSADAQAVIALIEALPDFNTLGLAEAVEAFEAQVFAARAAYDALLEEQKAEVTNYKTLTQAEAYLTGPTNITPRETHVCEIDSQGYPTLEDAVAAVQDGQTIKLLENVTLAKSVTLPNGVTLDLHGKTIDGSLDTGLIKTATKTATSDATPITITDLSDGETKGKIVNSGGKAASYAVLVDYGSNLTLDKGVSLCASGTNLTCGALGINVKSSQPAATIHIKNANLSAASGYPIKLSSAYGSATIEILDGSFSGDSKAPDSIFIYNSRSSTVTVHSGTFKNWDPEDDMNKLAANSYFCIEDYGIEVKTEEPDSYQAYLRDSNYYLTGDNLYRLALYKDLAGKTVEIAGDVSCTYPADEYFGENGGTPAALTLNLKEGSSLTGIMPLGIADITVTGEIPDGFFSPFDEKNYEITEDGNVYRCRLKTEGAVATVTFDGSTYTYTRIQDAISDAKQKKGSILKLNKDVSYSNSVSALRTDNFDWTLDLNGHTYTYTGKGDGAFLLRYEGNTLNIIDSSDTEEGTIIVDGKRNYAIGTNETSNKCKIVIGEGVTIQGNTILIEGTNNTLDVSGTIATGNKNIAIQTNGSSTKNSTITLHDGAIVTSNSCAIYHPGTGTLNVYKATVTGGEGFTGIEMRAGTLNVYDGAEITGGEGEPGSTPNGNGTTTNNAAIAVAQHNTTEEININIYGGTFTGGAAFYESNPQGNSDDDIAKVTIQIKGGTFTATDLNADSVYSEKKTGFITGGKFSSDVKEYVADQHDQLVTNKETTPFWVDKYTDIGAADAMGQTVYKVTYNFDGESVDVYYLTEAEAEEAIEEAGENVETKWPAAVKPTPSGGGSGSGSYLPVILSPVRNQTVSVIEHGTLTMSVWASRASSYQWYVDRGDGRDFVAIAGATGPSLTIWPDMGDNGNRYYCRAMNGYGGVNSPYFTLCVVRSALPPKTGDQVSVTLWVCLMALGVAGALTAWNRQRNR